MNSEDIAKVFAQEVREKKRIGSNIFKRVSTRKGGTWMYSMRVPTKKELKELNGAVSTFNLNEIISYENFIKKSEKDQKMLMDFWRSNFKTSTIMEKMGIEKNRFYRILGELGIDKSSRSLNSSSSRMTISEKELNSYLEDKNELMDYEAFRLLVSSQQNILIREYAKRYTSIPKLADAWEGSVPGTLYYINARANKEKDNSKTSSVAIKSKATETNKNKNKNKNKEIEDSQLKFSSQVESEEKPLYDDSVSIPESTTDEKQSQDFNQSKDVIESPIENNESQQIPVETVQDTENIRPAQLQKSGHNVDVSMISDANENSFSFSLKGTYSKEAIIRRLNLLLEEINDAEERLSINIQIKG